MASCRTQTRISCRTQTRICLMPHSDLFVFACIFITNLRRNICTPIINDNHLGVYVYISQYAIQAKTQIRSNIINRKND